MLEIKAYRTSKYRNVTYYRTKKIEANYDETEMTEEQRKELNLGMQCMLNFYDEYTKQFWSVPINFVIYIIEVFENQAEREE